MALVIAGGVIAASQVSLDSAEAPDSMAEWGCTRAEWQTTILRNGQPYYCKYLADFRTFAWQPEAPWMPRPSFMTPLPTLAPV